MVCLKHFIISENNILVTQASSLVVMLVGLAHAVFKTTFSGP